MTFITKKLDKAARPHFCCLSVFIYDMSCFGGAPLDQQETSNNCQSTNYIDFSIMPIDQSEHSKSYQHLQISRSTKLANRQLKQFRKYTKLAIPHST
jgi:hypothetical protein